MVWTIRMRNPSPSRSKIDLCVTYRAWRGLKLALQDPKVYMLALFAFTDILGLGFIQFFPTSVMTTFFLLVVLTLLQSGSNNGFLNHYHTLTCIVGCSTLIFTWLYYNLNSRAPWLLAAILCISNARHAGKPARHFARRVEICYLIPLSDQMWLVNDSGT